MVAADWIHRRLSRETSSGRYIPEMDGLRFIAITMVVLFHLNGYLVVKWPLHHAGELPQTSWLAKPALLGFHGVELFFVISGFILALPFAAYRLSEGQQVNLGKYYLRRLTRLEPPYIVSTLMLFVLAMWVQGRAVGDLLPHLAASMAYLHNLVYASPSSVIGVAWSLEIEVQFYLLVPLLSFLFAIRNTLRRRALLCGVIALSIAARAIFIQGSRESLSILFYLQFFLSGFLLADFYVVSWREQPVRRMYWDGISVAGWPLLFLTLQSRFAGWLFAPIVLVLYCAAFKGLLTTRILSSRWIATIGGMCYSIYLIHYEVISLAGRFTRKIAAGAPYWLYLPVQFMLVGTAILIVCGMYFALLEKPCMRPDWPVRLRNQFRSLFSHLRPEAEMKAAA